MRYFESLRPRWLYLAWLFFMFLLFLDRDEVEAIKALKTEQGKYLVILTGKLGQ